MTDDTTDSLLRTRASLLARLRDAPGDQAAWGEFVAAYGPQIAAWCRRWGLQDADADDVTQAVLVQLTRKLPAFTYDPGRRFRGWVRTLAQHAWTDFHRARKERGSGDSQVQDALETVAARDDLADRLQAEFDRELLDRATALVRGRVEERTWRAFELTAVEGRKGADAAAALGMKVATVFVAKSKVQAMLRDTVRELEDAG